MRSRAKIIDATLGLIEAQGFPAVNVSAVAAAAGVSRQTVYSIFGSREELVSQALITVAMASLAELRERLAATTSPTEYVVEMIVAGREHVREQPVLAALLRAEGGNPLFDEGMIARARPVVASMIEPLPVRDDDLVEVVTRTALSVVLFDSEAVRSDDDLRRFLHRWLAPMLAPAG